MPKDIRSYFTSSFKPKQVENNAVHKEEVKSSRKRKKLMVLSDSDEEPILKSPRKNKKKESEETSKYFEVNKEKLHQHFGNNPVKRKKAAPKIKKIEKINGEVEEMLRDFPDDDDDFSSYISSKSDDRDSGYPSSQSIINNSQLVPQDEAIDFKGANINSERKTGTPLKLSSPRKSASPQKSNSPQKPITGYFSPSKNESPKNGKISCVQQSITNVKKNILNELCEEVELNRQSENIVKDLTKVSPVKIEIKSTDHDISPECSDSESIKTPSPAKVKKLDVEKRKLNISPVTFVKKTANKYQKNSTTPTASIKAEKNNLKKDNSPLFELWVDKYRPINLKQIIGQQGEKSNVNKLLKWLKNWFGNHDGNKKVSRPGFWAKDDSGAFFKAALLSGPPGIGKTTTAHLVCKELNMDIVEFNASDTRSKKLLHEEISELLSSKSLSPFMQGGATSKQRVLLMDEVDGMAGNEDRGGIQELIALIKNSKVPVICMCNDRNHPKIRSLVNYCFDLRFNRPRVDQIKGAMMSVCYKENLKVKPELLTQIIASTNQDIRLVLNHLAMLSARKEQELSLTNKEVKMGAWDVARKVFSSEEHKSMSIHDKCDLFFHDYSIAPLFVHENYLNVIPYSEKGKTKQGKMELFTEAIDSLCYGDLVEHSIRSRGTWSLLPTQAIFSSVFPGHVLSGRVGGMINFPTWLGKNSRKNKLDRMCQEIQVHTRLKASSSKEAICTDYAYKLRDGIVSHLTTLGSEGVEHSLQFLHDYHLLREDLESLTELTSWPNAKDHFSALDSKVKAAFTRAYNKHPVLTPFSVGAIKKNKKGSNDENELVDAGEEAVSEAVEGSDVENDDISTDGMISIKKKDKQDTTKKERSKKESASSRKPPRGGKVKKK